MSDWVNWQQFADLNKDSLAEQDLTDAQAREAQQAEANTWIGKVRQEQATGMSQEAKGGPRFRGTQSTASYGEAMAAAEKGMAAGIGAQDAPWEKALRPNRDTSSPWDTFAERMGGIQADAQSFQQQREANRVAAEEKKKAEAERNDKMRADKQKFYAGLAAKMASEMGGTGLMWQGYTQESARGGIQQRAQQLLRAKASGEWDGAGADAALKAWAPKWANGDWGPDARGGGTPSNDWKW